MVKMNHPELNATETKSLSNAVLTDAQKKRFEETKELDFSFGIRGLARFRCNMFNQTAGPSGHITGTWQLSSANSSVSGAF